MFWQEGKWEVAKKVPRISTRSSDSPTCTSAIPDKKEKVQLDQTLDELRKVKVVQLAEILKTHKIQHKKERKSDILKRIQDLAATKQT